MESEEAVFARRIGQTVGGRWKLERLLGIGGMAAVYAASTADGRTAAIKLLHPEMSRRQDVRERFIRESGVANMLGHPGVVQILEHGSTDDEAYLAMELLVGESLGERVKRQGGMPPAELLDFLDQVLDVLIVAHDKGVIHRDLKPENLFVLPDGKLKVLDFGLARLLDDVPGSFKTRTGLALGTLPYMAPEQALGRRADIDGRVDLFALGATAFRILSGRKVHEAPSEAELLVAMATKPAPPLDQIAALPPELCNIVDLALAFAKDARYPSARLMQADVRAVRRGEAPPYARSRVSAREEATRADRPAPQIAAPPNAAPGPATAVAAPAATTPNEAPPQPPQTATPAPPRKRTALWVGLSLCGVLISAAALAWGVLRRAPADESVTAKGEPTAASQTEPTAPAAVASGAVANEPAEPAGTPRAAGPGRPAAAAPAGTPVVSRPAAPEGASPAAATSAAGPGARTTAAAIPGTSPEPAVAPPPTPRGTAPASQPAAPAATPAAPAPPPAPPATTEPSRDQAPARGKKPRGRDRRGRGDD